MLERQIKDILLVLVVLAQAVAAAVLMPQEHQALEQLPVTAGQVFLHLLLELQRLEEAAAAVLLILLAPVVQAAAAMEKLEQQTVMLESLILAVGAAVVEIITMVLERLVVLAVPEW